MRQLVCALSALSASLAMSASAFADTEADLAKKLANPVAAMISLPFQYNYDKSIGAGEGYRSFMNVQPVVPVDLTQDWNLISRTILPIVEQSDIAGHSGKQFGLGDTLQSFFFSPKLPTSGGVIWGVGPAFLLPTATDPLLGGEKWGLGVTGVALVQKGAWTYGVLGNYIGSVAGDSSRQDVSSVFIQPFLLYITSTKTTFGINSESTFNVKTSQWSVPINFSVSQLFKVGSQPMQLGIGARYWVESPETGASGWGARLTYTLLF